MFVGSLPDLTFLACAVAFFERGKCYMLMTDYKRALYDFSAAIRAETKKKGQVDTRALSNYYRKYNS